MASAIASSSQDALISYGQQVAAAAGVPWSIFYNLINQESGWDPNTPNSSAGCVGIAQICDTVGFDTSDPYASLAYAARRLGNAYHLFGNWPQAVASYNAGVAGVQKSISQYGSQWLAGLPSETQNYVSSIMGGSIAGHFSPDSGGGSTAAPAKPVASDWSPGTKTLVQLVIVGALAIAAFGAFRS